MGLEVHSCLMGANAFGASERSLRLLPPPITFRCAPSSKSMPGRSERRRGGEPRTAIDADVAARCGIRAAAVGARVAPAILVHEVLTRRLVAERVVQLARASGRLIRRSLRTAGLQRFAVRAPEERTLARLVLGRV